MSRFSPLHELGLVWRWPKEYTLRFKAYQSIFVLGACVTETDRQFDPPTARYTLKLRDAKQTVRDSLTQLKGSTLSRESALFKTECL